MGSVLFPLGVRLSTWVVLGVFLVLGVRDRRYWWAAAAWIGGFETAYQLTNTLHGLAHSGLHSRAWWPPVVVFGVIACGAIITVYISLEKTARPSLPIMAGVIVLWAIWVATGFHVNGHSMVGFDPTAEAINEAAKTLWALAYLIPLLRDPQRAAGGATPSRSAIFPQAQSK